MANNFDRGESIPVTVNCDDEDGANLDVGNFVTIVVKVIHKHLQTELDRFSLADSTVTLGSPTSGGNVTFIIPQSVTATAAIGMYEYQVKTTETDASYENSTRNRTFRGDCFYLKKALT